jgi:hypothetical protein
MRTKAMTLCGAVLLVGTMASGCSDSQEVTLHKPGVYKGPTDPLVEKQATPQQQESLQARFKLVQTDR